MAKFWKHVKGFSDTSGNYTYINWTDNRPTITRESDTNTIANYGEILTSGLNSKDIQSIYSVKIENAIYFGADTNYIDTINKTVYNCTFTGNNSSLDNFSFTNILNIEAIKGKIGTAEFPEQDYSIIASNPIQAPYFNAVSDQRQKENVNLFTPEEGLDIVNQIPVYSFNYINSKLPSIGIMAQDLEHIQIGDFNFITCDNNNVLSIKEDKLIYILWAAIQQLSRKVAELEDKLK